MGWTDRGKQVLLRRVRTWTHPFLARPAARWALIAAFAFLAAAWVAAFAIPNLPGDAPLVVHYTTTFGIDALGSWRELVHLPITGTVLVLVDLAIAWVLTSRDAPAASPASATLLLAAAIIAFVTLVGTVLLWRMNAGSLSGLSGH